MTNHAFACLVLALSALTLRAGPAELALVAAMKLPDAPNYSWTTAIDDDARSYTIDGKTDRTGKDDFSLVDRPMISVVRRRVSRGTSNSDNQVTAIYRGNDKLVIQIDDHWKKIDELPEYSAPAGSSGRGRPRGGMGGSGGMGGRGPRARSGSGTDAGDRSGPAFSNLQLTLSRPHEEITILVASHTELKADGDTVAGTLSETGAKLLLVHEGQNEITPLRARGTFRLWVKEGMLVKYEVKLEGTLAISTGSGRREVTVNQTATTLIKDVGTTKFEVPDEARKKLGG